MTKKNLTPEQRAAISERSRESLRKRRDNGDYTADLVISQKSKNYFYGANLTRPGKE